MEESYSAFCEYVLDVLELENAQVINATTFQARDDGNSSKVIILNKNKIYTYEAITDSNCTASEDHVNHMVNSPNSHFYKAVENEYKGFDEIGQKVEEE